MHKEYIQRNSLIGPVEEKTGKSESAGPKTTQNPFGGPVRRLVGSATMVVALAIALCDRSNRPSDGLIAPSGHSSIQKADIIDDIIEIIEEIINPPMPPRPVPDPVP